VGKSPLYAGRILIYSTPAALTQHIEWAISQKLGQVVDLTWINQPLNPSSLAMEFEYKHQHPVADQIANALKGWHYIRFEISQSNKSTGDIVLYRATPDLGLHQASLASNGDVVINENQVNTILKNSMTHDRLINNLENALGNQWEAELEPYRIALASGMKEIVSKSG
jgi:hypothetical protein